MTKQQVFARSLTTAFIALALLICSAFALPQTAEAAPQWTRIAGSNALDTMYKIAKAGKGDFASEAVILATNKGYKDALAASSLAGILAAPVVLTTPDTLAAKAKQAIKESGAKTIYIVGGPKAVSNKVEKQIKSMGKDVERIYGNNAAETSVQIAMVVNYVLEQLKVEPKGDCIIATQASFKDALSIAPYSYTYGVPIYLTDGKGKSVSDLALREMRAGKHKRAIIVGGTKAVSSNVEKQLKDNGLKVVRLWGQNAYQTSNEIAKWEINNGMVVDYVGAATAKNFKDALSGAAYCGLYGAPLLLVDDSNLYCANNYVKNNRSKIKGGFIFGGTKAVGTKAEKALTGGTTALKMS